MLLVLSSTRVRVMQESFAQCASYYPQGFVETRRKLLGLKPNLQQNWTAYAVANHVANNTEKTVQAIDAFIKTLKVNSQS